MKYPAPRTVLSYLASHGPSAVQIEALRLLDLPVPDRFPTYARGSKEALLRRLACNHKKAAHARLDAMKQLFVLEPEKIDADIARLIGLRDDDPRVVPAGPAHEATEDHQQDSQVVPEVEPCVVPIQADAPATDLAQRTEHLERGRKLANRIFVQLERCYRTPFNKQEAAQLDSLQARFLAWERETHIQFPAINTLDEFPDPRLRPVPKVIDQRAYLRQRQVLAMDDLRIISAQPPEQAKPTRADAGLWGGAGPGI